MTILEVLQNTMEVIRSKLDDTNTIKLLYLLNNETIDSSVILPMENSMTGNVLEAVIADILITYYNDPDGGYWSHQKNGKSIDLIYHSDKLKKHKKCADKVSEILLEVKSAVKNFNAKPSNKYTKFKSKFKHAFILYILYEIDDLKSIILLNKYNIKIYNYSKMVRKNKISNNKTKALIENNKRLYESIMRDVARTVKKHLNEDLMDDLYDIDQENDLTIEIANKIYDEPLEKSLAKLIALYLNIKKFYLSGKDYNGNICLDIAGKNESHQPFSQELEPLYDKCCLLCKKYKDNYSGEWCRKLGEFLISITKTFNIVISFRYELKYYCSFRILKRINTPCNNKYELLNYFKNKFLVK